MVDPLISEICSGVVNWVNNTLMVALYDLSYQECKEIRLARTDPNYEYLRNLTNDNNLKRLEEMIGTNIPLPSLGSLGSDYLPKDFNPAMPYLLTRQRFIVLKTVIKREQEGFVLSGPHGVSKSYTMYLLAFYAVVNSTPLLYIPKCKIWVSEYWKGGSKAANKYLLSLLFYYNYDILSNKEIREMSSSSDIVRYCSEIMSSNQHFFYLLDEHNELFKQYNNIDVYKIELEREHFRKQYNYHLLWQCTLCFCVWFT
ncbi:hypothetical protein C9374_003264 [Naegleria lovaniensis]|uniref:Uncharacterized protein n=1 Tax=Naegleria lovaniensis TaxID=51637 RepID=A0AA88KL38_NAELO|nr:uncharacterized protein C9374_003264 [Naegleria lovaniensis]KAG2385449.1 hypothetical protein C9374_003264 [Naegleria lovaniensis]